MELNFNHPLKEFNWINGLDLSNRDVDLILQQNVYLGNLLRSLKILPQSLAIFFSLTLKGARSDPNRFFLSGSDWILFSDTNTQKLNDLNNMIQH